MTTAYITHADCVKHDPGPHHPECPARVSAVNDRIIATGLDAHLAHYDAPFVSDEQLLRVHDADYLKMVEDSAPARGYVYLDPDTVMSPGTLNAIKRCAGAGVLATDLVMQGKAKNAFCNIRPCGHHAESDRAMGFSFYNSIAVAAAHAVEHWHLARVAIVDFDVHHGNGTEQMFRDDPHYLMVGTFQHPYYPYSGADSPAANMRNVPLPRGSKGDALRRAVEQVWLPALREFKPEMIFISAGFDAHAEDNMAGLCFVDDDYAWATEQIQKLADEICQGRVVSMLEGGYNLNALGRAAERHVRGLAGL